VEVVHQLVVIPIGSQAKAHLTRRSLLEFPY